MTYAEVLALLEGMEKGSDLINAIKAEVAEKNREAQNLRERLKKSEAKILSIKEAGIDTDSEDIVSEIDKIKNNKKPALSEEQKRIKALEDRIAAAEKSENEAKSKLQQKLKTSAVRTVLEKLKANDPDFLAETLVSKIKLGDDGESMFYDADGNNVTLEEGVSGFLKSKPHFINNAQVAGSGSNSGGFRATQSQQPTIDQLADMSMKDYVAATGLKKAN